MNLTPPSVKTEEQTRYFANFEGIQWKCLPSGETFYRDPDESNEWIDGFMTVEQLTNPMFQHFDGCCETDKNFEPLGGGSFHRPAIFHNPHRETPDRPA